MQLRPYQEQQKTELRAGLKTGQLIQMLMSPTGSGKTEVAKSIIEGSQSRQRRAWFIVDSVKLLDQTLARFHKDGLYAGAIQANHPLTDYTKPLQVVTVQSLRGRLDNLLNNYPPELVLIDEAHALHQVHIELIEWCRRRKVPVIGLSATPWRRGLGRVFDRLICTVTTADLTDMGFLVPTVCYAPTIPSLKGVKTKPNGDWVEDELAQVMGDAQLMGDVVQHWRELGENRKTMVFACNVEHSKRLAKEFCQAGVAAAHIDGYMPTDEANELFKLYQQGKIRVLVSVAMLIKGVDDPSTSCIVIARPTRSIMLHFQMVGRGLRLSPDTGKTDCIIIDHSGNLLRNGKPTDDVPQVMDTGEGDRVDRRPQEQGDQETKQKPCPKCSFLFVGLLCPKCGNEIVIPDGVAVAAGKLTKLEDRRNVLGPTSKQHVFAELLGYAQSKGKKEGWAQYAYQAFMKELVDRSWVGTVQPKAPSPEMENWVKGYNVRKAKSLQKRRA